MPKGNFFVSCLVVVLSALSLSLATNILRENTHHQPRTFEEVWGDDWNSLSQDPKLAPLIKQISKIEVDPAVGDTLAETWAKNSRVPLSITTGGKYRVEILIISDSDNKVVAATVQTSFFDLQTGNLAAEISRRYEIR